MDSVTTLPTGADATTAAEMIAPSPDVPENLWYSYSDESLNQTDLVQRLDFQLDAAAFGGGVDTAIVADTITVSGAVELSGCRLLLVTRNLTFLADSSISSIGKDGVGPPNRVDGQGPGANGEAGHPGAEGRGAGAITIVAESVTGALVVTSKGGAGGAGQDGGWGINGSVGTTGQQANNGTGGHAGDGGTGGVGGNGMQGGAGGAGGAGGIITILFQTGDPTQWRLQSSSGAGGAAGAPGTKGLGGPGGPPGGTSYFQPGRGGPASSGGSTGGLVSGIPGHPGAQGPDGVDGPPQPSAGATPTAGGTTSQVVDDEILSHWASANQLQMLLISAETDFLNGQLAGLDAKFDWIARLACGKTPGDALLQTRRDWSGDPSFEPVVIWDWSELYARAIADARFLASGLDAFGYAPHFVGAFTYKFLQDQITKAVTAATPLETSFLDLVKDMADATKRSAALTVALSKATIDIATTTATRNQAVQDSNSLVDELYALSNAVVASQNALLADQQTLQTAVEQTGGKSCDLVSFFKFYAAVIEIVVDVFSDESALEKTIHSLSTGDPDDKTGNAITEFKYAVQTFKTLDLGQQFSSMQTAFKQLQDAENQFKAANVKIVTSTQACEAQLANFSGVAEVRAYQALLRHLADLCTTRNAKQYAYTQLLVKIAQCQASIDQLTASAQRLSTARAKAVNPAEWSEILYLGHYLLTCKLWIGEMIDLTRRSVMYETAASSPVAYKFDRLGDLTAAAQGIDATWLQARQTIASDGQAFNPDFEIDLDLIPDARSILGAGKPLAFTIPVGSFSTSAFALTLMTLSSVSIEVPVATSSAVFNAGLLHCGHSTILAKSKVPMNFMRESQLFALSYENIGGTWTSKTLSNGNTSGDDTYLRLSPYAVWQLSVASDTQVDWANTKSIKLTFACNAVGVPA